MAISQDKTMKTVTIGDQRVTYRVDKKDGVVLISALPLQGKIEPKHLPRCSGYSIRHREPTRYAALMKQLNAKERK